MTRTSSWHEEQKIFNVEQNLEKYFHAIETENTK